MTTWQFKKAVITRNKHYFFSQWLTILGFFFISVFFFAFFYEKPSIKLAWFFTFPLLFFILGLLALVFMFNLYSIKIIQTGKSREDNTKIIKDYVRLKKAESYTVDAGIATFTIQVRKPNWKDYIFIMNNFVKVFLFPTDQHVLISVQPFSGSQIFQPPGDLKVARRIRNEIEKSLISG